MPDDYGQVRYEAPEFKTDAEGFAAKLAVHGTGCVRLAAFATAHDLIALDQGEMERGRYFHRPNGLGPVGDNAYTLWMSDRGNMVNGAWLMRGQLHVPAYLIEKGLATTPPDSVAVASFLLLVETARKYAGEVPAERAEEIDRTLEDWAASIQRPAPGYIEGASASTAN